MRQRGWRLLNFSECKGFIQSLVKDDCMEIREEFLIELEKFVRGNLSWASAHPGDKKYFRRVKRIEE